MALSSSMDGRARAAATGATPPGFVRRAGGVAALGLAGVATLLWQPLPPDLAARSPLAADAPVLALKALLVLNPALLVVGAAAIGAALAHRVGLRSMVAGTASTHAWARTLGRAAALGLALGLGLAAFDAGLAPQLGEAWLRVATSRPSGAPVLAGAMLYGGLAEEVMLRWGAMSLSAWALASLPGLRRGAAIAGGIGVAATLFAAGHLPVLAAQLELTPLIVTRTVFVNGAAGLVYGWLFCRHHLEAAVAAHAATHLGLAMWWALAS